MISHQAKFVFNERVFYLGDFHGFSYCVSPGGQKNREIIPLFFRSATPDLLIIVNYHAFHVRYMNKCDLTHFVKNRRKSSRKRLRGLLE